MKAPVPNRIAGKHNRMTPTEGISISRKMNVRTVIVGHLSLVTVDSGCLIWQRCYRVDAVVHGQKESALQFNDSIITLLPKAA